MGNFRFYRRVSIFGSTNQPVEIGSSLTVGMRGAHMTVGRTEFARRSESPAPASTTRRTPDIHSGASIRPVDATDFRFETDTAQGWRR